ncbi:hypothetical protein AYO20_11490 [Fonsecaea nubica]|uniref:Uncharacterized protein n=1 Tax=Fonsecaea nubica TaxID=856822 RepID=A0A178BS59_9EURO|nr:hypothetical protein AYO20_11490 [Fonsecaea nubica]OAL20470.1 hypothetical protein AYO20_11490 [Fonsecaea nubica]
MATDFQFEDNSIPTYSLGGKGLELFLNEELTDLGEVRSSNKYRIGTITDTSYSTQFHRLEEAHGSLASHPPDADDASLVVLRITPKTDISKRRFKKFTLTLKLEPGDLSSNAEPPSVVAFEPAADGDQYFQEHITAVTNTNTLQGTLGVKPPMTELSVSPSKSTARQFEERRLLKLTTTASGESPGMDTEVTFEITPAVEKDGIGDRLAVALIVKRAPGANFFITAFTRADVSYRIADTFRWRPGRRQGNALRMGPFGPKRTGMDTHPEGIDTTNLMMAADQPLKKLTYLHLPEKGTQKLFLEQEAKGNTVSESSVPATTGDSVAPESTPTAPTSTLGQGRTPPTLSDTQKVEHKDSAEPISAEPSLAVPLSAQPPPLPLPVPSPAVPALSAPRRRLPNKSALSIRNSQVVRHRMMASYYQNLARLHLEEAEEMEALIEMVYEDQTMTAGI